MTTDLPPEASIEPDLLLAAHHEAQDRVLRDRASHVSAAVPLAAFGLAALVCGLVAALAGQDGYELAWAIAAPIAFVAVFVHYWRLESRSAMRPTNPWIALAVAAMTVLSATVIAAVGTPSVPFVAAALAYLAFGLLWQSQALLACSALVAIASATIAAAAPAAPVAPADEAAWLGIVTGVLQLGVAASERLADERRRRSPVDA